MTEFIVKVESLSIDFFTDLANKLDALPTNNQLLTTYGPMLEFAKRNKAEFDETTLIGLAHMVYGWMPTMIQNITIKDFFDWENLIHAGSLDSDFLKKVMNLTNDSIVGASKLLHFLNPEMYPIYDSRVYKTISGKEKHNLSKDVENYICYTRKLRLLAKESKVNPTFSKIEKELVRKNYIPSKCSRIRILEVCLYASADKRSSK
jgi:hypothetical protein